ncbi:uncharacterized protein EV154DRAFT_557617 [Mucor mucedo]|uniref:uncharacterized protein n=1 Tax=Mucor mucedo TaxID=29922 RepID=UPI002220DCCF|nr:uncharacterized protein EV154DRAFT_557617 [Mucor mucedo]KAI7897297.1 hypothetical protein EV154DRAFT_557617 [Mucor mucedo]
MTNPVQTRQLFTPQINERSRVRPDVFLDINVRYPPRIPRLIRRPVMPLSDNDARPSSISSAISMTREYATRTHTFASASTSNRLESDDEDYQHTIHDLHCASDEKAVDLAALCDMDIQELPSNINYVPLKFRILSEDGGRYSSTYTVENVLRNDGTVYCSEKCGTINLLLEYVGSERNSKCCSLSHIIVKSPQYGYTAPCKEGMIFMSHKPINVENTRAFDLFTRENYERYVEAKREELDESDPVAWFSAIHQRQCVIEMSERSGKYVLVKLLRSDHETSNMDIQYIGFVGYSGSRCFANGSLC